MILRGCVLTSELAKKAGYAHPDRYRKIYQDRYFVHDNKGYIPVQFLKTARDQEAAKKCNNLDDYLPLSYFARYILNTNPANVRLRTRFMKRTGQELFSVKRVHGADFIYIPKEFQEKFKKGYVMTIKDWKAFDEFENVIDHYIFCDWCIVILK